MSKVAFGCLLTSCILLLAAVAILVILPMAPLRGRHELSARIQCASQLAAIGRTLDLYHSDFRGANPPNLPVLIETADLVPKMFVCPSSGDIEGDYSYIYRGADLTKSAPPKMILAHDRFGNHNDIRQVLFADGNVKKMHEQAFHATITRDNELRREMSLPEIPADAAVFPIEP